MRQSSLKLLSSLSRDDIFRHLLSQTDSTNARQIVSTTYWRVCFYVIAMAIRLVHQSEIVFLVCVISERLCWSLDSAELAEYLPALLKLCEWITLNSADLSQAEKSTLFNFCQMPIDRITTTSKGKQDLLLNLMK